MNELINIKQLMKSKTPSLSRCVKHFNNISNWVKTICYLANELGLQKKKPIKTQKSHSLTIESSSEKNSVTSGRGSVCRACGRSSPSSSLLTNENWAPISPTKTDSRKIISSRSKAKGYLCLSTRSLSLSLNIKRQNILLEDVLWKLCNIAEVRIFYLFITCKHL